MIIVGVSAYLGMTPAAVFFLYVVVSLVTLIAYGFDKSKAKKGKRRTPESTLHILSLLGGWPGALIAQQMFRHKTKKQAFRIFFCLTVLINLSMFVWVHTPEGSIQVQKFVSVF